MNNLCKKRTFIFLAIFTVTTFYHCFAQKSETKNLMQSQAEDFVKQYFFLLNQIGEDNPTSRAFRDEDINTIVQACLDNETVPIYDDITKRESDEQVYFPALNYLQKIGKELYKTVKFDYELQKISEPILQKMKGSAYYEVKVEILKRLSGLYKINDEIKEHDRTDVITIYVKFMVLEKRPLKLGKPKIHKIESLQN